MIKPRFEASADIESLCYYLRERQSATYREMAQHLNRDITGRDRYVLTSARRKLERIGIVFVCETNIGVRRAKHAQVATLATDVQIRKIQKAVRRSNRLEQTVDIQQLTAEERATFNVGRAIVGAVSQFTRRALRNVVKKETERTDSPIPTTEVMRLFRPRGGTK